MQRWTVEWTPKEAMRDFDFDQEFWTDYVPYCHKSFDTKAQAEAFAATANDYWGELKVHEEVYDGFEDGGMMIDAWDTVASGFQTETGWHYDSV